MHLEISIALNYLLQNLYNKLPRRRVNLFGEELLQQLKRKYNNHWYPTNPVKGSAYRCLKTPTDPIISIAAAEVNINLNDIIENLPVDLWIWIDPGEVSYRVGNGGQVKILWKGNGDSLWGKGSEGLCWADISFNPPENNLLSPEEEGNLSLAESGFYPLQPAVSSNGAQGGPIPLLAPTPTTPVVPSSKPQPPMMTTAAFAQTKFGSTKLKTNNKRMNPSTTRQNMSPTEFSNYIKQKQQLQQLAIGGSGGAPSRPRSLSPNDYWSTASTTSTNSTNSTNSATSPGDYYSPFYDPVASVWSSSNSQLFSHHLTSYHHQQLPSHGSASHDTLLVS